MSGRRAEAVRVVESAVERFLSRSRDERLRLYRLHLQASVSAVSPLAADLAALAGMTLGQVASLLPIPRGWPDGRATGDPRRRKSRTAMESIAGPSVSSMTRTRLGRSGAAVRGHDHPAGDLGFVPERGVLEVVSQVGEVTLHTCAGKGYVVLAGALPEGLLLATVGRPMDGIVSHPALDGRGYMVSDAFNDEFADRAAVVFRTGLVPLALPWAEELDREVASATGILAAMLGHAPADLLARYAAGPAADGLRAS